MKSTNHNRQQERFWDQIALKKKAEEGKPIHYPAEKEMKEFFQFLCARKNKRVLEIGCGTGRYTLPLLKKGCFVHGTEISAKSINRLVKQAKALGLERNLTTEKTTFESPKACIPHKGKFDQALMVAVIHHFFPKKRKQIFQNIVDSLKKGGRVTALEPNPLNPFYYCLYFWRWLLNKKNVNRWSTETGMLYTNIFNLKRLFTQAGLKKMEIKRYAFLPSIFGNYFPIVLKFNDIITNTPILKEFSAYIWIKGEKS